MPVLYAGKKYLLPALTQLCAKFLEENLHVDNVCIIYEQCLHFDESAMLDKCRSFIETQTKEVFASDVFKDISRMSALQLLLDINISFFICVTICMYYLGLVTSHSTNVTFVYSMNDLQFST